MGAQTAPRKKGLSMTDSFVQKYDYRPLELTNYGTQLSAFQQTLWKLWEVTPDPASESNKLLFEPGTEVLI